MNPDRVLDRLLWIRRQVEHQREAERERREQEWVALMRRVAGSQKGGYRA